MPPQPVYCSENNLFRVRAGYDDLKCPPYDSSRAERGRVGQAGWLLQNSSPPGTFSFACQKRTRKAPATFEAREARTRGCTPLVTPKQKGSIQKIQVAPLEDFLCCADFESLRDGGTPTAADAASRYDLSRENAMPGGPQTARHCSIINNSSAEYAQSSAERIPIVFLRTAPLPPDAPAKRTAMPRHTGSPP